MKKVVKRIILLFILILLLQLIANIFKKEHDISYELKYNDQNYKIHASESLNIHTDNAVWNLQAAYPMWEFSSKTFANIFIKLIHPNLFLFCIIAKIVQKNTDFILISC